MSGIGRTGETVPKRRQDRRVGRTRRLLKHALLELIVERGYEKLSIRDITERADVGRSTFYSHYGSKEDLLFDGFDAWLLSLADREDSEGVRVVDEAGFRFSRPFLEHVGEQPRFFHAFVGGGAGRRVRRRVLDLVSGVIALELDRLRRGADHDEDRRAARVQYLVGAFLGLAGWWVDNGCRLDVAEVDRIFQGMALPGLSETAP